MALKLRVDGLKGRFTTENNTLKITFRGIATYYDFEVETLYQDLSLSFRKTFEWPLNSKLDQSDDISFAVCAKLEGDVQIYGSCYVHLYPISEGKLIQLTDEFCDKDGRPLSIAMSLALHYTKPTQRHVRAEREEDTISIDRRFATGDDNWDPAESESLLGDDTFKKKSRRWTSGSRQLMKAIKSRTLQRSSSRRSKASNADDGRSVKLSDLGTVPEGYPYVPPYAGSDVDSVKTEDSYADWDEVEAFQRKRSVHSLHSESYIRGLKWIDFQVRVALIEAQISGTTVNPYVEVQIGRQKKKTSVKDSSNRPVWHEDFTFAFYEPASIFFDKLIVIKTFTSKGLGRNGLIGEFSLDVSTVHSHPNHRFDHKWAPIIDPNNALKGAKGYLKCSIAIGKDDQLVPGSAAEIAPTSGPLPTPSAPAETMVSRLMLAGLRMPKPDADAKDDRMMADDIESNLILPQGCAAKARQQAHYSVRIHCAEALPATKTTGVFKKGKDELETFVQVSFAGHTGTTSSQKGINAVYDELVLFKEMFPPLVQRIKLKIVTSDRKVIATHFIELPTISDAGIQGFLPVFGPTFINFYGAPPEQTDLPVEKLFAMNQGQCEGVCYRGRLLVSVSVETFEESVFDSPGVTVTHFSSSTTKSELGKMDEFLFFGTIMNVTMLDKKLVEKPLHLEASIGDVSELETLKKQRDGKVPQVHEATDEIAYIDSIPDWRETYCNSTRALKPELCATGTGYIPYGDSKPCFYSWIPWFDQRWRIFHSNLLNKLYLKIEGTAKDVEYMYTVNKSDAEERILAATREMVSEYQRYRAYVRSIEQQQTLNKLDQERLNWCLREMNSCMHLIQNLKSDDVPFIEKMSLLDEIADKLESLVEDPQDTYPDVIIWLMQGTKRIAYYRMSCKDIMYSPQSEEKGALCGKLTKFYFKLPGLMSASEEELWRINGQVTAYFWLGINRERTGLLAGLPRGFGDEGYIENIESSNCQPPMAIEFTEKCEFELRCHLFQARYLSIDLSKSGGLVARVIFQGNSARSQPITENATSNPVWDETLILRPVDLYGSASDTFKAFVPTVVVEIFNEMGQGEFIGQTIVEPSVKLLDDAYQEPKFPPKLKWYTVKRGMTRAGEILAAFELLQLNDGVLPLDVPVMERQQQSQDLEQECTDLTVPASIRPVLTKYRLEVFYWNVRNLPAGSEKVRIDIDLGRQVLSSSVINNYKLSPNFSTALKTMDVELPENFELWPAISIRVVDCRSFGRDKTLGQFTVRDLSRVLCNAERDEDDISDTETVIIQLDQEYGLSLPAGQTQHTTIDMGSLIDKKALRQGFEDEKFDWWTKYFTSVEEHEESRPLKLFETKEHKEETKLKVLRGLIAKTNTMPYWWPFKSHSMKRRKIPKPKKKEDKSHISKLVIYDQELESQELFDGFSDWVDTFPFASCKASESDNAGVFRGKVKICRYPLPSLYANGIFQSHQLPSHSPVQVMARVYVVRAVNLTPADMGGKSDPYLCLSLGKTKINDKENYIANQLNPVFGKVFELEATLPSESELCIQVWDWDLVSRDDLIGETRINLEDRFYSRHRASCGLAESFRLSGYHAWRDSLKPTQILAKLCKENRIEPPVYMPKLIRVGKKTFHWYDMSEVQDDAVDPEVLALHALRNWEQVPKVGCTLVPEHVESRVLTHPKKVGANGRLEMWIDIFPMDILCRNSVDISPRKPKSYELRLIIWNTEDVILDEVSTVGGEAMSDIYVRGTITGPEDRQCTDVHYRSMNGEGNFNWRFVYRFDYLEAEEKIVVHRKEKFYAWDKTELKLPPVLELQVMDADLLSKDDFLGALSLNLTRFPRGTKLPSNCTLDRFDGRSVVNLFQHGRMRGWWPFSTRPTDGSLPTLAGKLEAEFQLLTTEEADKQPVGRGRGDPEKLEMPTRPATSFLWITSPFKSLHFVLWHNYKSTCLILILILLLLIWIFIFIYAFPMYAAQRLVAG